jgi:peptidoglycan hydrolase CwlO-like protein
MKKFFTVLVMIVGTAFTVVAAVFTKKNNTFGQPSDISHDTYQKEHKEKIEEINNTQEKTVEKIKETEEVVEKIQERIEAITEKSENETKEIKEKLNNVKKVDKYVKDNWGKLK